jgi:phage baseplate assembly protein W
MAINKVSEYAISLPFQIDDFGNIATATSQSKIWAGRVRSVIGTAVGERVMRADYGTKIPVNFFENADVVSKVIEEEVNQAFFNSLPELELEETIVVIDELLGTVNAEIKYFLPSKEQTAITIGIAQISPNEPLEEELS